MAERASGTSSPVAGRYHLGTRSGLTRTERVARGKAARAEVPRDSRGVSGPLSGRPDPIALLEEQARSRVAGLVPVRWGRMVLPPELRNGDARWVFVVAVAAPPAAAPWPARGERAARPPSSSRS